MASTSRQSSTLYAVPSTASQATTFQLTPTWTPINAGTRRSPAQWAESVSSPSVETTVLDEVFLGSSPAGEGPHRARHADGVRIEHPAHVRCALRHERGAGFFWLLIGDCTHLDPTIVVAA